MKLVHSHSTIGLDRLATWKESRCAMLFSASYSSPADQQLVLLDANSGVDIVKLSASQSVNAAQIQYRTKWQKVNGGSMKLFRLGILFMVTAVAAAIPMSQRVYAQNPTGSNTNYVFCADEHKTCSFSGTKTVAYGASGSFTYKVLANGTECSNAVFGDPKYGALKACYYDATSRSVTVRANAPQAGKQWSAMIQVPGDAHDYSFGCSVGADDIMSCTPASVTVTPNPSVVGGVTGTGVQPPTGARNTVSFLGTDTTTQGAWKGIGNFNAPPASNSLIYGKDGVILPDTEGCDAACNSFPSYVSFGPRLVNSSTPGNIGSKPYSTHAYVDLVQGPSSVAGPEPPNPTNTNFFQCNYTYSNPAAPWAPMVAWRPTSDTRQITQWYTCGGITSFYLELGFGNSTHNLEVYAVDDQNGGTQLRSEQLQVLDGDTNAVLYDSGSFTNFTGGVYYKWSITGHVKIKVINTSTNGTSAVINGLFFN